MDRRGYVQHIQRFLLLLLLLFISRVSQVYANKLSVCEEWPCNRNSTVPQLVNRELKQQRRRRLRKRQLRSVFALLKTLSRLFHLVLFIRCRRIFLKLNSKRLYRSSKKEEESRCLVFTSSTKRKIRKFHVVVVQRRQRKVQKT